MQLRNSVRIISGLSTLEASRQSLAGAKGQSKIEWQILMQVSIVSFIIIIIIKESRKQTYFASFSCRQNS
jgi:hypothetical protein